MLAPARGVRTIEFHGRPYTVMQFIQFRHDRYHTEVTQTAIDGTVEWKQSPAL